MQRIVSILICCLWLMPVYAQIDTAANRVDSFLLHQKGLIGKLAKNLVANRPLPDNTPVRTDLLFDRYKNKIIRQITVTRLEFGVSLSDTSKRFKNTLTRWANDLHHNT